MPCNPELGRWRREDPWGPHLYGGLQFSERPCLYKQDESLLKTKIDLCPSPHARTHVRVNNGQARPARCTQGLTAPEKARVPLCDQMDNPTTASSVWDTENGEGPSSIQPPAVQPPGLHHYCPHPQMMKAQPLSLVHPIVCVWGGCLSHPAFLPCPSPCTLLSLRHPPMLHHASPAE